VADDFLAMSTPGHTPGHMTYYYRPEHALFAGDSMAVVADDIHFMARIVTPDLNAAKESMLRCLALDIKILCPGHRGPMTKDVQKKCLKMTELIANNAPWPLLG